jgi:hypothetical protein
MPKGDEKVSTDDTHPPKAFQKGNQGPGGPKGPNTPNGPAAPAAPDASGK